MELYGFIAVIFFASILQGITGFGSALIAAPLALLFVDKTTNVISLAFMSLALNGFLLWHVRRAINKQLFITLSIASLIGLPLGFALLKIVSTDNIRIIAGGLSVLFALLLFSKIFKIPHTKLSTSIAGFLAGILHTTIAMSGPPVVLLNTGREIEKDEARKTLAAFFLFMSVITVLIFVVTSSLTKEGIIFGLYSFPAALIGGYIGSLISKFVSPFQFRTLTLILICITGCVAVYSGLQ